MTPPAWYAHAARTLEREQRPNAIDYWSAISSLIDPEQAWFWSKEWQAGERESRASRDRGETLTFAAADEAIAWLQRDDDDR